MSKNITDNQNQTNNASENGVVAYLLKQNLITQEQILAAEVQVKAKKDNTTLVQALIAMGFITEAMVHEVLSSDLLVIKRVDLRKESIPPELISKIPREFALLHKILPLEETETKVVIATNDPYNIIVIDQLSQIFPFKEIVMSPYSIEELNEVVEAYYKTLQSSNLRDVIRELATIEVSSQSKNNDNNPVVKFVDTIIQEAIKDGASDIHIEPDEHFVRFRYRIDGVLVEKSIIHKSYWSSVCVRIKVISGMNIAESRKPQDGAINTIIQGRPIDFRVSSLPTIYGENIVMRVLDRMRNLNKLEDLGFNQVNMALIKLAIQKPEGVIIVTGPTGSGKTTTLYSLLAMINSIEYNIMTLEEPVEYRLPMIRQSEINHRAGFDFASGLRSILRQDPDIVFLGEIRDEETASTALRASITGHQVFSTLHTNNAITAITRLIDMGIKPFMLSGALVAVIAQRLVRKLCPHCKIKKTMTAEMQKAFLLPMNQTYTIYEPGKCNNCMNLGYKGRITVAEVLFISENLNIVISSNPTIKDIDKAAKEEGFIPIQRDGILKIIQGYTSWNEVKETLDMTAYTRRIEEYSKK